MWGYRPRAAHVGDVVMNVQTYDGPCPVGHPAEWTSTQYEPATEYDPRGERNRDFTLATFTCPTCGDA